MSSTTTTIAVAAMVCAAAVAAALILSGAFHSPTRYCNYSMGPTTHCTPPPASKLPSYGNGSF